MICSNRLEADDLAIVNLPCCSGEETATILDASFHFYSETEDLAGTLGHGKTDGNAERQHFSGVRSLELNENLALEAARLQDELLPNGERMAVRDLMLTATARSTSDRLVVAGSGFRTDALEPKMRVTNPRDE